MKVGMIFECGPAGADKIVCQYLAQCLKSDIVVRNITLDNKPGLLRDCGVAAAQLFTEGCQRVIIVWDLYPPWRQRGTKPCRREDRQAIAKALRKAGLKGKPVYLGCIEEELEAWLIADGRALSAVLSRPTHPVKVKDAPTPESVGSPKARLKRLFQQHRGQPYTDLFHAEKIIKAMPDLNRIKRCASFVRFALKATGVTL